jgi:hypothetical protein
MLRPRIQTIWLLVVVLVACATTTAPREYIDNDTAATVTVASAAFVFARERPDLAIHAQDYVTITPVQVNRAGQRVTYLYCQLWSTIDRRRNKTVVSEKSELALVADDRRVELPRNADIRRLGLGHSPVAEIGGAEIRVAAVNNELLHFALNADQLRIGITNEGVMEYFLPWKDGRKSAQQFLRRIGN